MPEFHLPFKPEELLAPPPDDRLWASHVPDVENWKTETTNSTLDTLIRKVLQSNGHELAEPKTFSTLFGWLQAWPRLDEAVRLRISDLLVDAAKRIVARSPHVQKTGKKGKADSRSSDPASALRVAAKVAIFYMHWAAERLLKKDPTLDGKGRGKKGKKPGTSEQEADELKEAQKLLNRQRSTMLTGLTELITMESMPWLWTTDTAAFQRVAERVSDAGFEALGSPDSLKHHETRQAALSCIASPLLQEGHQHSNLLVAAVSKLTHALRGGEHAPPFVADVLLRAHCTALPRLLIVELTQHCTPAELTSQSSFQKDLGKFLVAVSEKLPHIVLANIAVLLPLLDVDCYPLRSAIVESIGKLLEAQGRKIARVPAAAAIAEGAEEQADGEEEAPAPLATEEASGDVDVFTLAEATKKDLLDTLMARTLDKTAWVRAKALQSLTNLAANKRGAILPRDLWPQALEIGARRMQDTSSFSRKSAMQLVRALVATHPYGPALVGGGSERAKIEKLLKEVEAADESTEDTEEQQEKRAALKKMNDCYTQRLKFVEVLDDAEARLRVLLSSRVPTDVTEAINVVVELRLRELPVAKKAFNQVLGLVWSRHEPIKEAAVEAFRRMHLDGRDAKDAVRTMLEMYKEGVSTLWTYTELASVQELIQQAAEQKHVDADKAVPHLMAAMKGASCHEALRALTAFGVATPGPVLKTLPDMRKVIDAAKDTRTQLERAGIMCHMLQRLHACIRNGNLKPDDAANFLAISEKCTFVVLESFCANNVTPQWFGAAQGAMDISFDLSTSATDSSAGVQCCPDKLWEVILERMLGKVLEGSESSEAEELSHTSSTQVACTVFVAGHLALRMLVYLEQVQAALKKKRMTDEDAKMAEKREQSKKPKKSKGGAPAEEDASEAAGLGMAGQDEREADAFHDLAEYTLLYGQNSILSKLKPLVVNGLLDAKSRTDPVLRRAAAISMCKFMTVSTRFCKDHLQLLFSVLFPKGNQSTSLLVCEGEEDDAMAAEPTENINLPAGHTSLLDDLTLRQSLLVAVGDLLFRHPNIVAPWMKMLYAALGGDDTIQGAEGAIELRLTALLVLTHLVLNDMIKASAVFLVRALWLTACTHERTARVARLLFQELSKKTTRPVYNYAAETIALLPDPKHQPAAGSVEGGPEERVQWLMQFLDKEKEVDQFVVKLSERLGPAADRSGKAQASAKQGADSNDATVACLAHALGALTYSEKCLGRLHDIVVVRKSIKDALAFHAVVRDCIMSVVEKARSSFASSENTMAHCDAIESTITAIIGVKKEKEEKEDVDIKEDPEDAPEPTAEKKAKRGKKTKGEQDKEENDEKEDGDIKEDPEDAPEPTAEKKAKRGKKTKGEQDKEENDEKEDGDIKEDPEDAPELTAEKKGKRGKKTKEEQEPKRQRKNKDAQS